jgi:hypothetical protein
MRVYVLLCLNKGDAAMTYDTNTENTSNSADETLNLFKVMTPIQQMEIVEGAVDAILNNLEAVEAGNKAANKAESGQLDALKKALKDYAEPLTEEVWEKVYRANVAARLDKPNVDGSRRYKNAASRDVMVNLLKVATMGLTLAKHDRAFEPNNAQTNLKKYTTDVRPELQKAIDPATGKPRLRSIAAPPPKPKKLPKGYVYLLIGCEDAGYGIVGANSVLSADSNLDTLKRLAHDLGGHYAEYLYVPVPEFALEPPQPEDDAPKPKYQNAVVFSKTVSASSEHETA